MIRADEDAHLLARAAGWDGQEEELAELSAADRLEFATAQLHDRILRVPANAAFLHTAQTIGAPLKLAADLIGVVPGAFHREHRNTGADGARVVALAQELHCAAEVIPTESFGTLDQNAAIILRWLQAQRGKRIALVSLSKGGAEVKRVLGQAAIAAVESTMVAWVNLSGPVQGTPLIQWLRRRPLRWWSVRLWLWWHGASGQALEDLRHDPAAAWPTIPKNLRVVHVLGFPLPRHLSHPWAPRAYARLAPLGPNDGGGILLQDCLQLPGIVCPIWGADHYLMPRWDIRPLLRGALATALNR